MSLNHIVLMGRLTADPEIRLTDSGVDVVNITVAVDRDFTPKGADKQTDFFNVTAWRGTAKFITAYFNKGRMIIVDGRMESRKYVDKDGNNRTSWGVTADRVYFGDSKRDGDMGGSAHTQAPVIDYASTPMFNQFAELDGGDGDLPF